MSTANAGQVDAKARTKIVATIGPACEGPERLTELVLAGVDVFRLNTAHGDVAEHTARVAAITAGEPRLERPIAILVDLGGPKIRLGDLPGDLLDCPLGAEFRFVRGQRSEAADELVTTYDTLVDELQLNNRVMLADGTVVMRVISREPDAACCRVVQPGIVRSRQGVNLPGVKLSTPALTDADRAYAAWAAEIEADFIGLSFVRDAADVQELKSLLKSQGLAQPGHRQDRKARGARTIDGHRPGGRRCDDCPGRSGGRDRRGPRAGRAKADHRAGQRLSEACHHGDANARQHAALVASDAGPKPATWPMPSSTAPTRACCPAKRPSASIRARRSR